MGAPRLTQRVTSTTAMQQKLTPEQAFAAALQLHQAGRLAEAERGYRYVLAQDSSHSDALHFLGVIAMQTGKLEPALELVRLSVEMRPDGAVYRNNLGQVLERMGHGEEAAQAYRAAVELDPQYAEAWNNLGHLLQSRDELAKAESNLREAIRLNPQYPEPHTNLGNLFKDRGDLDDAIGEYRRAIELSPQQSYIHSNLLLTLHYHPDYSPADLKREHEAWAQRHVAPLASQRREHSNDATPGRRLRIGYVSPDFREHAIARFILPVLTQHDANAFEVFAYADVVRRDETTGAIRANVHRWREITTLNDAQLADAVRADGIDILVDLAAHSGKNRLLAFARKPAPIQVTWLAYCSTTGVDAIDYRLTDRFLDPPGTRLDQYTEASVHLPGCYWCYSAPAAARPQEQSNERLGGPPTFGCLNNFAKVTNATLELWTLLLQRVPESRLLLFAPPGSHRDRVRRALSAGQIAENRLSFVPRQPFADYLDTWRGIDVALDPIPYGGGTTTCDALWMGVPVVTLAGRTAVARAGSSLLSHVGLEEFVARSQEQYVDCAAALIRDTDRLAQLRGDLRGRLRASPVMSAHDFTRGLESAYREMWRNWCASRG